MDSLGTLAAGIAHDFNNIRAAIVGCADALRLAGGSKIDSREKTAAGILQACLPDSAVLEHRDPRVDPVWSVSQPPARIQGGTCPEGRRGGAGRSVQPAL